MKTKATLLYLLTLLLTVFSVQTAQAQTVQDALYIYRNDGQLNAFFYGDIDHFEYSKTDTLGVEQPDYVVQEVYTLDTLYRIPISAIDSVAFVTPETKIKADVFCPDKSIVNYITASDSVYWILLAKNTPASLIPKVGSKLLIEEEGKFIPDGFGGLVDAVQETSNGYKVTTSALALTDIYEQLVIKAAGASPNMARARTRVLDGADIEVPEVEIKIPPVSATLALKYSKAFLPENDYVEFNGELQGSLSSAISTKMRVRAFLTITPFTGFRYYQETFIDEDIENAATLSGSLSGRLEVPFLPSPTHKFSIGKLKFELGLGLFLEAQATALSLSYKHSKTEKTRINMTFDHTDIAVTPVGPVFDPFFRWSSYCEKDTTEWEFDSTGQYSLGFGVFAKAETKFKVPIEKMPKFVQAWSKKSEFGFEASFGVDVGTKTEYAGPLVKTVPELLQTPPFYAELNKANMSVSAYAKLGASLGCGNWGVEYSPEAKFWEPINRGLVPDLQGLDVSQDMEQPIRPYRLLFKSPTSDKKVLTGTKVGFAVFDAEEKLVKDTLNAFYWISSNEDEWIWKKKKSTNECVMILDPGKDDYISYTAYPMVEFMGHKVLADQKYEFKLDPARIEIAERIISAGSDLGSMEIEVIPNMANVEVKAEADWLNKISPAWLPHKNQLTVYWPDLPEGVKERRGVVRLIGKSQKGETLVEDSIVVHQFIPYIELTPDKLEFEAKGGTQTVTVGKTNLTDLKVKTSSDYLTLKFEGNTITVTMDENKTSEERGATIYVEGKTPDGKTDDYAVITVYQEAKAGIETTPNALRFDAEGGEQTVTIDKKNYKYCGGFNDKGSDDWLRVVINDNATLTVIASPNMSGMERTGIVYAFATDVDQFESLDQVALKAIPVTQSAGQDTNIDFKIEDIDLEFDYTTNRDGRQSGGFFKIGFIKERIKVTRKDNTYTVVCENKGSYYTEFLSFDVTMQDNKFGPITNLTAGRTSNDGKDKFSFDATDIELSSSNSELATWKGYDKNGMKVSNLSGHNEYWTDNGYIADPKNLLRIDITLDDEYE